MTKSRIKTLIRWLWKTTYYDVAGYGLIGGEPTKNPWRLVEVLSDAFPAKQAAALRVKRSTKTYFTRSPNETLYLRFQDWRCGRNAVLLGIDYHVYRLNDKGWWVVKPGELRPYITFTTHTFEGIGLHAKKLHRP